MEQVFFNLPLEELEPIIKRWIKEAQEESRLSELKKSKQPDGLLTVQGAAKFLNLAVPTIYTKVSKSELPYMKKGKRLYFSQEELLKYVKSGLKKTTTEIEAEVDTYLIKKGGQK